MSNGSWLEGTPPKTAFTFGAVSGVAASAVLAFAALFSGNGLKLAAAGAPAAAPTPAAPTAQAPQAPQAPTSVQVSIRSGDHVRGNRNAKLLMVEYSDFQCPFCSRFAPTIAKALDEYKDKIAFVYRHFPLDSIHPYAKPAALASECASEQGKFWEMHDALFARQDEFANDFWPKLASDLKLDAGKFKTCMDTNKYADHVQSDYQEAVANGGTGTPYTIIGTTPISGALPYESIKQAIDQALK